MGVTVLERLKEWWASRKTPPKQGHIDHVHVDEHEYFTLDGPPSPDVVKQIESLLPPDEQLDKMTDDEAFEYGLNQLFAAEERGFDQYRKRRRTAHDKIKSAVAKDGVKDAKIDDTY